MIVTRRWLEEFIKLDGVSDEELVNIFNSIGLEVADVKKLEIPKGVVVGKIVSCQRHPDADKLSLCQVDVGDGTLRQIICGAKNVSEALYVPVALEGTTLPAIDLEIKPVKLRGVDSFGMICSASELGLPELGDGIIALDKSIGELELGRELSSYPDLNDTVIELELTANRGDCLSIYGVARDLSAYFDKPLKSFEYKPRKFMVQGIARAISLKSVPLEGVKLLFNVADAESINSTLLTKFRVAIIDRYYKDDLEAKIKYALHSTGVILRVYDFDKLKDKDERVHLEIEYESEGIIKIKSSKGLLSYVGISSDKNAEATKNSKKLLIEASYIDPIAISKATYENSIKKDELYYHTSRGTNPDLIFGAFMLYKACDTEGVCEFGELPIIVDGKMKKRVVNVDINRLQSLIGTEIPRKRINAILKRLGIITYGSNSQDVFGATIPEWRHDMENLQDIAEEILRLVGIDEIEPKPLNLVEKSRLTDSTLKFQALKSIRARAVASGFFEAVTYAFMSREKALKYGFDVVDEALDLTNPIVEELNTMRTTIAINLLDAVAKNINYGKKRVSLFEIGSVFDNQREESSKFALIHAGFTQEPNILNQGKPKVVDFAFFVEKLNSIIGEFELRQISPRERLFHPYIYARIYIDGEDIGFISKIHPEAEEEFGGVDMFFAEVDLEAILPKHKNASFISNFQGVYKDLSILIDKKISYTQISNALKIVKENNPLIKRYFPLDLYEDESLGNKKSLTIRVFLQSESSTLSDLEIEGSMNQILEYLKSSCGAELR